MSSLAVLRIVSLVIVVLLRGYLPTLVYQSLFFAALFSHYVIAHATTGPRLKTILEDRARSLSFVALLGLCPILLFWAYPRLDEAAVPIIVFIVGIHIIFSDVYSLEREYGGSQDLFASSLILNSVLYAMLLSNISPFNFLSRGVWLVLTGLAFLNFGRAWILHPEQKGRWDYLFFQTAGLLLAPAVVGRATYIDPIFYHVVFWLFYPFRPFVLGRTKFDWVLAGKMAALFGLFLVLTPIGIPSVSFGVTAWIVANNAFSVPHFVLSLGTSSLNPSVLTSHFAPPKPIADISEDLDLEPSVPKRASRG